MFVALYLVLVVRVSMKRSLGRILPLGAVSLAFPAHSHSDSQASSSAISAEYVIVEGRGTAGSAAIRTLLQHKTAPSSILCIDDPRNPRKAAEINHVASLSTTSKSSSTSSTTAIDAKTMASVRHVDSAISSLDLQARRLTLQNGTQVTYKSLLLANEDTSSSSSAGNDNNTADEGTLLGELAAYISPDMPPASAWLHSLDSSADGGSSTAYDATMQVRVCEHVRGYAHTCHSCVALTLSFPSSSRSLPPLTTTSMHTSLYSKPLARDVT